MTPPALDPEQQLALVERARSTSGAPQKAALERLLADFRPVALAVIHRTLAGMGLGPEHAEEALQQAVLKFLAVGLRRYRGESAPRTYFTRMAINACLDLGRAAARQAQGEPRPWSAAADEPGPERLLSVRRARQRLARCLERLPSHYRRSVRLYYLDELGDCRRCSTEQGIGKEAFMKRLSRARALLARCMKAGRQEPRGGTDG